MKEEDEDGPQTNKHRNRRGGLIVLPVCGLV